MPAAQIGSESEPGSLLARGRDLGIRPLDMLVGVLQPALHELGRLWQIGAIEPATEARFTRFCGRAIEEMQLEQGRRLGAVTGEPIFLLPAEGNRHTIGIRMIGFTLREAGHDARVLPEMPDLDWLVRLCEILRPSVLGVSVSIPEQVAYLARVAQAVRGRAPWCRVVAGGFGLRDVTAIPAGVSRWHRLEGILDAVRRDVSAGWRGRRARRG